MSHKCAVLMLGTFACARFRFDLVAQTSLRLNAFAGSTLRGGFGHAFKRAVCVWPPGDCRRCLLRNACSYPYIFETAPPPGAEKLRGIDQIPRPFVIEPPQETRNEFPPGERFAFHLVLIGRGLDYLPYFVFTFTHLGQMGLGPGRGQFGVAEIVALGAENGRSIIYAGLEGVLHDSLVRIDASALESRARQIVSTRRLTVKFLTPTRIQRDGTMQLEVTFQDLVRAILRRMSSLCYFHCGQELDVDFRGLIDRASAARTVASDLQWKDQERFSGRQHQRIEMGGVVGRVEFEAPDADFWKPYAALLAAGEWVHVGKGCVMGLGKYRIDCANRE